jgi:hypothetical protein
MTEIDEQRKKVEELKRKILEQKNKGEAAPSSNLQTNKPVVEVREPTASVQIQAREVKQQPIPGNQLRTEEVKPRAETEKTTQVQHAVPVAFLQAYAQALKQAWSNGSVSQDEENILATLRRSMGISNEVHASLEQEVRLEIYLFAIVECWKDGSLTAEDLDRLEALREKFNISAEEHMRLEKQVRQEILKQR